ncbi:ureidoglycolate lyase [Algirhabdus cladophorae]|uniref:ureidoglycolate lyase n=1 Tax=Algirhabdus cladophorae TaxID=3377108 RepID=UPI003B8462F1
MSSIIAQPLTAEGFAPYGDVLECTGASRSINAGLCDRFHDQAVMDFGPEGQAGISLFRAQARSLPYAFDLMERHPEGSQAFIPMSEHPFLVIVAEDQANTPHHIKAFLTKPGQGVNYHRNTWHGVLTPLHAPGLFAVIDRIGSTPNLQEHHFDTAFVVKE